MAHSQRSTLIVGNAKRASEKSDKLAAHRRVRRRVRQVLHTDDAAELLPSMRELSDPDSMAKHGKSYVGNRHQPRDLRK